MVSLVLTTIATTSFAGPPPPIWGVQPQDARLSGACGANIGMAVIGLQPLACPSRDKAAKLGVDRFTLVTTNCR